MSSDKSSSNGVVIKELTFIALFSLMFSAMMGSGVFDIPQNVAHRAGAVAVIISWIITAIGMLAFAWALVYITNKRPDIQSGLYGYAKYGFGDYFGFNAAWGYWLNALLGNASYLIYIFATLGNFTLFKFLGAGNTLLALLFESILIWIVYLLINHGIKEAAIINILISAVKILALGTVIVLFIYLFKFKQFKINFIADFSTHGLLSQIKSTMLVTVWDFLGIEAACIYALRAKRMKDVAKATILGVIVVLLIDSLISILPFGIISSAEVSQLTTPSTASILGLMSESTFGQLIRLAVIISVTGALLAWTMLATNILYLAAEDRSMPEFMAKMNKHQVPHHALLVSCITLQVFVLVAYFTNSVYLIMIQLATSLILIPYFLSALFAFKLIINERKIDYLSFIKGFIATLYGIWLIYAGGLKYLFFSSILYLFGVIFYFMARKEQKLPLFKSIFEKSLFVLIIIVCALALHFWIFGVVSLT